MNSKETRMNARNHVRIFSPLIGQVCLGSEQIQEEGGVCGTVGEFTFTASC